MTLKNGVGWILSNALEQRSPTTGPQSWSWIYHEGLLNPGRETDWATCYSGGTIQFQENKLNTPTDSTLCRFFRPSICLTVDPPSQAPNLSAASTHPAPACQWPLQAHGGHSSQQPFQAQFFPSGSLSGLRTSSSRPLQTTCTLRASSPGQAPLPGCVSRPYSCLSTTSLDSVPIHLLASLVGPQLPQAKLPRPRSGLTVASPG
ncbi:putative uncharacterized protein FLJ92257 isoform X1 [Gorilla gorilla gorilla]|uniref:putative uncharacterized protein FLJ92257 isoform X1 n=1 Tax=Gorilla gorilla gorilla TaxID=9595 RepID=UPI0030099C01